MEDTVDGIKVEANPNEKWITPFDGCRRLQHHLSTDWKIRLIAAAWEVEQAQDYRLFLSESVLISFVYIQSFEELSSFFRENIQQ